MSRREVDLLNWIRKQAEKWSGATSFKAIADVVHFPVQIRSAARTDNPTSASRDQAEFPGSYKFSRLS
jgi:hypothetical protein